MVQDLVIGMVGSGGDGIVSAGESLIAAAAREGYHGMMTKSFGSQIRGGESSCRVRVSVEPLLNPGGVLDVLVALNWEDFSRFGAELPVGNDTVIIYEAATGVAPEALPIKGVKPVDAIPVPLIELAKRTAGSERAKNTIVLGLLAGWFGLARESILNGIRKKLGKKGAELLAANENAFAEGIAYAVAHPLRRDRTLDAPKAKSGSIMLTDGNDICAAAAIFAGCTFFGGYPITPSTEIMQLLTREIWKYDGSVLQAEDEIAGIGSALGASLAGAKSMTATSGPGMSLKTEILGLATMAELPLVIVNVQRGGPSTGLPTKPEQADLFQAAFSAHGDVLRPVLASTGVADTFRITVESFNIAEEYQTPVVLLTDQEIGQRKETVPPIDTAGIRIVDRLRPTADQLVNYKRFLDTPSGISPISQPGMAGGAYQGAGIEHNEAASPTSSGALHARMNDKRFRKLAPLQERSDLFIREGDADATIALISWGSSAGVCREAVALARAEGIKTKILVPYLVYPVAERIYREFLAGVTSGLVVELSHQGQLHQILRMKLDLPAGLKPFCRSGAAPFQPLEILAQIRALAASTPVAKA